MERVIMNIGSETVEVDSDFIKKSIEYYCKHNNVNYGSVLKPVDNKFQVSTDKFDENQMKQLILDGFINNEKDNVYTKNGSIDIKRKTPVDNVDEEELIKQVIDESTYAVNDFLSSLEQSDKLYERMFKNRK